MGRYSISAPDGLHHGDSFMPTYEAPNYQQKDTTFLMAELTCVRDGQIVLSQRVDLEGRLELNQGPFVLDNPTQKPDGSGAYWSSGPASCSLRMFTFDFDNAHERTLAYDSFEVEA